jgi:hypothetical protein
MSFFEDCKSLTRKNIQTCNLVATNATIENLNFNLITVPPAPPAPTCNFAVTRTSYFGAPDTMIGVQQSPSIQWEMLQFWTQYGRLQPFIPLLGAPILSPVLATVSLTPVPPPFGNPASMLVQEYVDFLNDAFAQLGLAASAGLQAQPAITDLSTACPQMAIRSTTLNLTNYVFIIRRLMTGGGDVTYAYAMDGAIPFMNSTIFSSQTQSGESVFGFGFIIPVNMAGQPQDAILDDFIILPTYFTPIPTILGFSTCGGQLATDQQMDPPASSTILLNP